MILFCKQNADGGLASADNVELGTACGKLHRVSVLAITDAGETALLMGCLFPGLCFWLPRRQHYCKYDHLFAMMKGWLNNTRVKEKVDFTAW